MSFQNRLKMLRTKRGLKQQDVAEILGITRQAYGYYESESNKREPDLETLVKLSKYFDVTVDYLLGNENDENIKDYYIRKFEKEFPDIDLMFDDMKSFTSEDMRELYNYVKFKKSQKE
ncbi:helix-turn-helix domain-containing protein [Microbulbifer pacificus]|uniref:helix-turn-helix domain-containing protein n=1 Tax=Microbulbifer pacificus TaxID=407164 RepID=UPI000CF3D2DC|nr:helix-turn-helix transcriptional regulator [Microbulbifer pacificus]